MEKKISFYSEGCLLQGILYLPEDVETRRKMPAILLCHGFAGVKELLLPNFGKRFSQHGFAALTFDYRGFGESEGTRGKLSPTDQIIDIKNAITFLQSVEEVDPEKIALWGTSYGGANAIVAAAQDTRVRCLSVQLTFGNGERVITRGLSDEEKHKLLESVSRLWIKQVTKNKEMMVGVDKVLSDEQSKAFYERYVEEFPALNIKIPFLTIKETMGHKPEIYLPLVSAPILIVGAENDKVNPPEESRILFEKANDPKELYMVPGATHYEVYAGEKFEDVAKIQLGWFKKYLG